jgi:hypothetical protein
MLSLLSLIPNARSEGHFIVLLVKICASCIQRALLLFVCPVGFKLLLTSAMSPSRHSSMPSACLFCSQTFLVYLPWMQWKNPCLGDFSTSLARPPSRSHLGVNIVCHHLKGGNKRKLDASSGNTHSDSILVRVLFKPWYLCSQKDQKAYQMSC